MVDGQSSTPNVGVKHDVGKPAVQLIPPDAYLEVGKVFLHGAGEYGSRNWEYGLAWLRVIGSVQRHTAKFLNGQDIDPDSGLCHMAHAACGCLMLLAYYLRGHGEDDRSL